MPHNIIKNTYDYCTENKLFLIFIMVFLFSCHYIIDFFDSILIGPTIFSIIMMGYGLQVTRDVIYGGTRLPKIMPKKLITLGLKGFLVFTVYTTVQGFLMLYCSTFLNFPEFELESLVLNYYHTLHLIRVHDPVSFTVFVVSGLIILYVTTFFMELSLARLADGGSFFNSFNFVRIKHAIDIIGWRNYAMGYTKIIISILVLSWLVAYHIPFTIIDSIIDAVLSFFIFVIEYIGIGSVYKVYVDNKPGNVKKIEVE